jgi:uncharacterized membrane protein
MKTAKFNYRSKLIGGIRGFTIILMIIFHLCFDLQNFGFLNIDIIHAPFWYAFPRIIVFLFLFASGMSLALAHHENIKWTNFWKRVLKISGFAGLISIVTYFIFPDNWIYFGTLHAIAVISVISLLFLRRPYLSLCVALMLFIPSIFLDRNLPWFELPHQSWDYISPFPWMGASLLGIFAVHKSIHEIEIPNNKFTRLLNTLGDNSLVIYLVHQPILFGLVYLTKIILK